MTKKQERILANIRKLDAELKKETESLVKEGYTIESHYNSNTNKDTLIIRR
jgi:hypothetical protein